MNNNQGRASLKEYFKTDKMPTEDHFADLIDSSLNKADDQLAVVDKGTGENSARFLGIGSTDPQSPLSIRNRTGEAKLIGLEDTDGDEAWNISVNPPAGNNGLLLVNNSNPDASLMVGADGNVGIGTQVPTEKLDVNGNVKVTNGNIDLGNGNMDIATGNLNLGTGNADIGGDLTVSGNTGIGTNTPQETLDVNGNMRVANGNINLPDGNLDIVTGNLNLNTGNANIGGDLAVDGNITFTNSNLDLGNGDLNLATGNLNLSSGTADIFGDLIVNGNTGVGTNTPAEKLDVNGNVRVENGSIELVNGSLDLAVGGANIAGGLTVNGNIGVGTNTPSEKLDVDGNVRIANGNLELADGNVNMATGSISLTTGGADLAGNLAVNGNTGMGTMPDPGFRLDVAGNIRASGNLTAQSFEGNVGWNNITNIPNPLQNFDGTLSWDNVTGKPNSLIPAGAIIMWSGSTANVPATWAICDGTNGTPDLSGRFIIAAGSGYAPGDTGGYNEVTLSIDEIPAHNHPHNLSVDPGGAHSHNLNNEIGDGNTSGDKFNMVNGTGLGTPDTNNAGDHIHTISGDISNTGGGLAHENRPPYYALVYIMKL